MKLKNRLLIQNLKVLFATAVITACLSTVFSYFYVEFNHLPVDGAGISSHIIVMDGQKVMYSSNDFDKYEIKDILMNLDMNEAYYYYKDIRYRITQDEFGQNQNFKLIKLSPVMDISKYYNVLFLVIIVIFLITFLIASLVAQKDNRETIIDPIVHLKKETEKLGEGELSIPINEEGYGEVADLCNSIEKLRLKLKDAIYYQEKSDDNRKFLVSSISHDLKTPVTAIKGYVEGVLDGVANTKEKQDMYLKKAVEKTNLLSVMIEDLLLYSKLDLNQVLFDLERINLRKYLENTLDDNQVGFERDGKRLALMDTTNGQIDVLIDAKKFQRVIQNILDNAKKHIDSGHGEVTILVRETNSSVIIELKDNGSGIKKEDLPHIFDRFYRADSARKVEGSSGLGLAIAKQIVEGLDGRIWARSEEGNGTSILISLKKCAEGTGVNRS